VVATHARVDVSEELAPLRGWVCTDVGRRTQRACTARRRR
jgi:hypothetical protein